MRRWGTEASWASTRGGRRLFFEVPVYRCTHTHHQPFGFDFSPSAMSRTATRHRAGPVTWLLDTRRASWVGYSRVKWPPPV